MKNRDVAGRSHAIVTATGVNPFEDELRFLRRLFARPRLIGAIAPSSPGLARAIAMQIDPDLPGPILELGPGTGVVTAALVARGIVPERITAIEYDPHFAALVASRFPKIRMIRGDAFDLSATLGAAAHERYAGIVSGIPLLNYPQARRHRLIEVMLDHLVERAPLVQFSYGLTPPIAAPRGAHVSQAAFVWRNLPPARVWVYRRKL